jgi:hypothetical protein
LNIGGSEYADALVLEESIDEKVTKHVKKAKAKPILMLKVSEDNSPLSQLNEFYQNIMAN